jgi:hypothetical protein
MITILIMGYNFYLGLVYINNPYSIFIHLYCRNLLRYWLNRHTLNSYKDIIFRHINRPLNSRIPNQITIKM